jgi:putative polyhydroxyalkanoate system protein
MPTIRIVRQHHLPHDEVRADVEELAAELRDKLRADFHWDGDTLCFSRTGASGTIKVGEDSIAVEVNLSLALSPLKSRVETTVTDYLDRKLA